MRESAEFDDLGSTGTARCTVLSIEAIILWKVRPKHISALVLKHLRCARQPMTGRRDASFLAGMLDLSVSKYYLLSAIILERQQI